MICSVFTNFYKTFLYVKKGKNYFYHHMINLYYCVLYDYVGFFFPIFSNRGKYIKLLQGKNFQE